MNFEEFLKKEEIIQAALDKILGRNYIYINDFGEVPCDIKKIGFEYYTINVARDDFREKEKINKTSDHANIYAYTRILKKGDINDDLIYYYDISEDELSGELVFSDNEDMEYVPARIRVTAVVHFETMTIEMKSRVITRKIAPRKQHISFPKKDGNGEWILNFPRMSGSMTKSAK